MIRMVRQREAVTDDINIKGLETLYQSAVFGKDQPNQMITTLSQVTWIFNHVDNPRKDISDFILACAKAGVSGDACVAVTLDSIGLYR